jgi:hypothetical protein
MTKRLLLSALAIGIALSLASWMSKTSASPRANAAVSVDKEDIGGVVSSSKGPEAGVWVIAETTDLPTKFVKIVVTDDQGRYLIPELPKANYKVWVRGYGLVDSKAVQSAPGKTVDLKAVIAPDAKAAAQYYPSNYWYALLQFPPKSDFPGTGASGNGISPNVKDQAQWIDDAKVNSCEACHQLGDKATREIPASLGHFDSSAAAWARRISSAQAGVEMNTFLAGWYGRDRALAMYADWTDRIKAGEYPKEAPPRPQGVERNIVITEWDWGTPKEYFHDLIGTDKRNPTINPNGMVYGTHEEANDLITYLDPIHNTTGEIPIPVTEGTPYAAKQDMSDPSPYWGNEMIWSSKANAHSDVMDSKGRVWFTDVTKPRDNPAYCKQGSNNLSASLYPLDQSSRSVAVYDPETKKFTLATTCFGTHHLEFSWDDTNTLWFSGGGDVVGWFNTKVFDETHDSEKAQGWTAMVVDTNGNGKRDAYVEPGQPADPTKDTRVKAGLYTAAPSPLDNTTWGISYAFPGYVVHIIPGSNPPATTLTEVYQPPFKNPKAPIQGFGPRGGDIDRNGVVWMGLTSGHFASFDRRKCKGPLNGPDALGQQCPEGWTLYPLPGPKFKGTDVASDSSYYAWVDIFDTFGLGKNVPIAFGNGSDSFMALMPATGKFVTLRVPYPMGFFAKNADGRIDDPKTGWKGKGIWASYDTRALTHMEGGKGTDSKVVKFQLRPDPLAK